MVTPSSLFPRDWQCLQGRGVDCGLTLPSCLMVQGWGVLVQQTLAQACCLCLPSDGEGCAAGAAHCLGSHRLNSSSVFLGNAPGAPQVPEPSAGVISPSSDSSPRPRPSPLQPEYREAGCLVVREAHLAPVQGG